ncbi:MAG: rane protein [Bryobacterales bacterium]|nr:rane protein [Bryobacterales bacterium]
MLHQLTEILVAWGPAGILLLSILDSSGVPVAGVFDAMLILISVKNPSVAWLCATMAVVGSMVGSTLLFTAAQSGSGRFQKGGELSARTMRYRRWFRRYGMVTVFVPALMPIPMPLKLTVISAGVLGAKKRQFITVVLVARVIRYFGEAWLGLHFGKESVHFLTSHVLQLGMGAIGLAVLLFAYLYWRGAAHEGVEAT